MLDNINAMCQVMHDVKLPADKKEELVKNRLKRVLVSAYKHVPYYRDMMKNINYNPAIEYNGPEDLIKFPITTKHNLKENDISMFLREGVDVKNLFPALTSGSTGIPLKIFLSCRELAFRRAKWLRVLFINKYSTIYKVLALVEPRHLVEGKTVLQKFGLLRRLAVNQSLPPEELTEILLNYKPHVLYGYTTQIDLLTLELIKKNIKPPGLKLVLLGGEIVHDHNRNLYVEAFGIDPIEYYGSEEMGIMAYETPARDGLHLCNDLTYFEFLDKNDNPVLPGEFAKVVVTDLLGTAMPIIRYDHGDIVTIKVNEDRDGNTEKRISKIFGRDNDYFILPDESTRTFCHLHDGVLREFDEIWQIRVIQKTKSSYQINIAASDDYFKKIEVRFKDLLYRTFSKDCSFDLFRVDSIEPDHSGKLRVLVSEIKDGYQANHLK